MLGLCAVVPTGIGKYPVPNPNFADVIDPSAGVVVTVPQVAVVPSVVKYLPDWPDWLGTAAPAASLDEVTAPSAILAVVILESAIFAVVILLSANLPVVIEPSDGPVAVSPAHVFP